MMFRRRIREARLAANLSRSDLASFLGVSLATLQRYEDGSEKPTGDILTAASLALGVRPGEFFRPKYLASLDETLRFGPPRSRYSARLHSSQHFALRNALERRIEFETLRRAPPNDFVRPKALPSPASFEALAETLREAWGAVATRRLVDVAEGLGVRVVPLDLPDGVKGFVASFRRADATSDSPLIAVSSRLTAPSTRMLLACGLVSLVCPTRRATSRVWSEEDEVSSRRVSVQTPLPLVESVARAFLFPRREAVKVKNPSHRELLLLREEYGMPMVDILRRTYEAGVLSSARYEAQRKTFRAKGWETLEPGRSLRDETPDHFEKSVLRALAEGLIGESKAAELLDTSLVEFVRRRAAYGGFDSPV